MEQLEQAAQVKLIPPTHLSLQQGWSPVSGEAASSWSPRPHLEVPKHHQWFALAPGALVYVSVSVSNVRLQGSQSRALLWLGQGAACKQGWKPAGHGAALGQERAPCAEQLLLSPVLAAQAEALGAELLHVRTQG